MEMEPGVIAISQDVSLNSTGNQSHYLTQNPPVRTIMWNDHAVPWVDIVLAIVCIILTIVSTCGNALAFRSITKLKSSRYTDKNNLGSITLVIFMNLAVTDFLQTLLSAPFAAFMLFNGRVEPGIAPNTEILLCNIAGVSYFIMSRASISIVAVLSLVRCIVILRPMNHHAIVNWRNVMVALTVVWIGSALLCLIPFMTGGRYRYWRIYPMCDWDRLEVMFPFNVSGLVLGLVVTLAYVTPFLLPGCAVILSSCIIIGALLVARQQKKICTRRKGYESVAEKETGSISSKQLSAAVTTLLVVLAFCLCYGMWWFNSVLYLMWKAGILSTSNGKFVFTELYGHTGYVYVATMGGLIMIYLNSALNPIIYYCRIFSKNAKDYKTSSSGPKGHQSSSSIEFSHRNSTTSVNLFRREDTEHVLDTLVEKDEVSVPITPANVPEHSTITF